MLSALAQAQEGGIVGPQTSQYPATTCYKLAQEHSACLVVGPSVLDYDHPRFHVVDLNGAWTDASNAQPYIYFYADSSYSAGYTIRVDMSLLNRPDAFGYMVDANTMAIVFPDDRDYTGKIENGNTIRWSNNTVWTKR
jgi:hypothetical protein